MYLPLCRSSSATSSLVFLLWAWGVNASPSSGQAPSHKNWPSPLLCPMHQGELERSIPAGNPCAPNSYLVKLRMKEVKVGPSGYSFPPKKPQEPPTVCSRISPRGPRSSLELPSRIVRVSCPVLTLMPPPSTEVSGRSAQPPAASSLPHSSMLNACHVPGSWCLRESRPSPRGLVCPQGASNRSHLLSK